MAASDMLIEIYIWLKVLSLEQRNWQKNKEDKSNVAIWQIILVSSSRYRPQKEKKALFLLWKVMNNA
jgi:hypothetical protein